MEIDFNPQPMANAVGALGQGINQGLQIGMQAKQFKEQRRQAEFEQDYRLAGMNMKLASSKWMDPDDAVETINTGVKPILEKYTGRTLPHVTGNHLKGMREAFKRVEVMGRDKNLSPDEYRDHASTILMDAFTQAGDTEAAKELALNNFKQRKQQRAAQSAGNTPLSPFASKRFLIANGMTEAEWAAGRKNGSVPETITAREASAMRKSNSYSYTPSATMGDVEVSGAGGGEPGFFQRIFGSGGGQPSGLNADSVAEEFEF